jgi:hypothetical protein
MTQTTFFPGVDCTPRESTASTTTPARRDTHIKGKPSGLLLQIGDSFGATSAIVIDLLHDFIYQERISPRSRKWMHAIPRARSMISPLMRAKPISHRYATTWIIRTCCCANPLCLDNTGFQDLVWGEESRCTREGGRSLLYTLHGGSGACTINSAPSSIMISTHERRGGTVIRTRRLSDR